MLKKLIFLLIAICSGILAKAQTPPSHAEHIFPAYTSGIVVKPVYTHSYNYPNVMGLGLSNMDLYIYVHANNNWVAGRNHISYLMKYPNTDIIFNQGTFNIDSNFHSINVGIIQDPSGQVYGVISYIDRMDATVKYQLHEWNAAGLSATASYVQSLPQYLNYEHQFVIENVETDTWHPVHVPRLPLRVTMDCHGLNKVALALTFEDATAIGRITLYDTTLVYEDWKGSGIDTSIYYDSVKLITRIVKDNAYVRVVALSTTPIIGVPYVPAPYMMPVGYYDELTKVMGSESNNTDPSGPYFMSEGATVAFGDNGNKIRVAFVRANKDDLGSTVNHLLVRDEAFTTVASRVPIAFTNLNHIAEGNYRHHSSFTGRYFDHIRMDCPDNYYMDIWSLLIFDKGELHNISAPFTPYAPSEVNDFIMPSSYCDFYHNPDIAYNYNSETYNIAWYRQPKYLGDWKGYAGLKLTRIGGIIGGMYYQINHPLMNLNPEWGNITLSKNNMNARGMFMAYPCQNWSVTGSEEMRSKVVDHNVSSLFNEVVIPNELILKVYPNPTTDFVLLETNQPHQEYTVIVYDIQGREIANMVSMKGHEVNTHLQKVSSNLIAGTYTIDVKVLQEQYHFTFIKK